MNKECIYGVAKKSKRQKFFKSVGVNVKVLYWKIFESEIFLKKALQFDPKNEKY